jgi:uncharacterized protein (DUF1778 family)
MNDEATKVMIGFRAEPELRAMIEQAAASDRRSVSNFIRAVISEYFDAVNNRARAA